MERISCLLIGCSPIPTGRLGSYRRSPHRPRCSPRDECVPVDNRRLPDALRLGGYRAGRGAFSTPAVTPGITASGRRSESPPCHGVAHVPAETMPYTTVVDVRLCECFGVRRLDLFGGAAMARFNSNRGDLDLLVAFDDLPLTRRPVPARSPADAPAMLKAGGATATF